MSEATLIFWQNIPSILQAPLIHCVAERWNGPVQVVTEQPLSEARKSQGWSTPDFGTAELIIAPSRDWRLARIRDAHSQSVHVFSGISAYPETGWTFRQAVKYPQFIAVFAEAGRTHDGLLKTFARRLAHKGNARRFGSRIDLLLTPGELGRAWYTRCGFPKVKIVNFPYFVAGVTQQFDEPPGNKTDLWRLLYAGQLIERKGVDVLLRSLSSMRDTPWHLDVVGSGPEESTLRTLANRLGLGNRVVWHGNLPNQQVRKFMAISDCFTLPSRFDGWGAVVNEALFAGTPVVVSSGCGSAELVRSPVLGDIVAKNSVEDLAAGLCREYRRDSSFYRRLRIADWAARAISPQAGADYLVHLLVRREACGASSPPWHAEA